MTKTSKGGCTLHSKGIIVVVTHPQRSDATKKNTRLKHLRQSCEQSQYQLRELEGMHALLGLVERLDHGDDLLATLDNELGLLEEVVEHVGLVELLQKLALEVVLRELHQCQRDRLWHHVDHLALHNVEVRRDQQLYNTSQHLTTTQVS